MGSEKEGKNINGEEREEGATWIAVQNPNRDSTCEVSQLLTRAGKVLTNFTFNLINLNYRLLLPIK